MSDTTVRAFEMGDWEQVAELFLAPNCQRDTLQMPFQSRDDIKRKLENPPGGMYRLVAVDGADMKVVGMIGLNTYEGRRAHTGAIGMFVHDDHQNQGIGSRLLEAALDLAERWLGLTRIELTVYTDNARAVHLYEKYGFAVEGTLRRYAFRDGAYVDAYAMARISE